MKTTPVFILGSGRSGTFSLVQCLKKYDEVEVHHEYLFENILRDAVLYYMKKITDDEIRKRLQETHAAAVFYSRKNIWIDCSNALPWVVTPLHTMFPEAKFIYIIRNGRRVVSSFYHKFSDVMYNDRDVQVLHEWLADPGKIMPPPEKKYWRPVPQKGDRFYDRFPRMDRFERLCYYWAAINSNIEECLAHIPESGKSYFKFEDLLDVDHFRRFLDSIGLHYNDEAYGVLNKPQNVHVPKSYPLSPAQEAQFVDICGETMKMHGYSGDYDVKY